jgi:hypothetical protein
MMTPIAMSLEAQQWEQGKAVLAFAAGRPQHGTVIAELPAAGWSLLVALPLTLSSAAPVQEFTGAGGTFDQAAYRRRLTELYATPPIDERLSAGVGPLQQAHRRAMRAR